MRKTQTYNCPNCGKVLPSTDTFCSRCGVPSNYSPPKSDPSKPFLYLMQESETFDEDQLEGRTIHQGKYTIAERIGKGGVSHVYKAFNNSIRSEIAIKIIFSHLANSANLKERFKREATIQFALAHTNIVRVFDFIEVGPLFGLTMELVQGPDLFCLLNGKIKLSLDQSLDLFLQILDGTAYAHAKKIIHRDIKPENILLLKEDGKIIPKITDFGIAKLFEQPQNNLSLEAIVGTPAYMAPEQIKSPQSLDQRTDIYALGILLFQMLTGRLPFDCGSHYETIAAHLERSVPSALQFAPELDPEFDLVIKKAMAKEPSHRFANCKEFSKNLLAIQQRLNRQQRSSNTVPSLLPQEKHATLNYSNPTLFPFSVQQGRISTDTNKHSHTIEMSSPTPQNRIESHPSHPNFEKIISTDSSEKSLYPPSSFSIENISISDKESEPHLKTIDTSEQHFSLLGGKTIATPFSFNEVAVHFASSPSSAPNQKEEPSEQGRWHGFLVPNTPTPTPMTRSPLRTLQEDNHNIKKAQSELKKTQALEIVSLHSQTPPPISRRNPNIKASNNSNSAGENSTLLSQAHSIQDEDATEFDRPMPQHDEDVTALTQTQFAPDDGSADFERPAHGINFNQNNTPTSQNSRTIRILWFVSSFFFVFILTVLLYFLLWVPPPQTIPLPKKPRLHPLSQQAIILRPQIAFLYVGPIGDYGWTWSHEQSRKYLERLQYKTTYANSISQERAPQQIENFIQQGYNIIVGTSHSFVAPIFAQSKKYPHINFLSCASFQTSSNVGSYFGRIYQGEWLAGMLAGATTKTNRVGFIASVPIPEIIRHINAFANGVKKVNPKAKIFVTWINHWYDVKKENILTKKLIRSEVDVIHSHSDSIIPVDLIENKGGTPLKTPRGKAVYSIAYGSEDACKSRPKTCLTSVYWNWGPMLERMIEQMRTGRWQPSRIVWETIKDKNSSSFYLSDISSIVSAEKRIEIEDWFPRLTSESIESKQLPFQGPLQDNQGKIRITKNQYLTDEDLYKMCWYVQGVVDEKGLPAIVPSSCKGQR